MYKAGIDVGSTTVKVVIFDDNYQLLFSRYERHFSDVKTATIKVLKEAISEIGDQAVSIAITGSGGMGLADVQKFHLFRKLLPLPLPLKNSFHKPMSLSNLVVKMLR